MSARGTHVESAHPGVVGGILRDFYPDRIRRRRRGAGGVEPTDGRNVSVDQHRVGPGGDDGLLCRRASPARISIRRSRWRSRRAFPWNKKIAAIHSRSWALPSLSAGWCLSPTTRPLTRSTAACGSTGHGDGGHLGTITAVSQRVSRRRHRSDRRHGTAGRGDFGISDSRSVRLRRVWPGDCWPWVLLISATFGFNSAMRLRLPQCGAAVYLLPDGAACSARRTAGGGCLSSRR